VPDADITVIGNTGDDIHLFGLKVCPDLDTVMYTLGGGINEEQGWGRADETFHLKEELGAYGVGPEWFGLGDRDFATHIVRTQMIGAGFPLSAVTEALCDRWKPGVRLIPMTDDRVETHVAVEVDGERKVIHFQSTGYGCARPWPPRRSCRSGPSRPSPRPGSWRRSRRRTSSSSRRPTRSSPSAPSSPCPASVRRSPTRVPVIGLSPIVGDAPVRGMADKVLAAVGVESTATAVAEHYGSGLLDGWLVDTVDAGAVPGVEAAGIRCRAVPLMMTDTEATARMAREALALAEEVRAA